MGDIPVMVFTDQVPTETQMDIMDKFIFLKTKNGNAMLGTVNSARFNDLVKSILEKSKTKVVLPSMDQTEQAANTMWKMASKLKTPVLAVIVEPELLGKEAEIISEEEQELEEELEELEEELGEEELEELEEEIEEEEAEEEEEEKPKEETEKKKEVKPRRKGPGKKEIEYPPKDSALPSYLR